MAHRFCHARKGVWKYRRLLLVKKFLPEKKILFIKKILSVKNLLFIKNLLIRKRLHRKRKGTGGDPGVHPVMGGAYSAATERLA